MESMGEIDESKAGASLKLGSVSWNCFLWTVIREKCCLLSWIFIFWQQTFWNSLKTAVIYMNIAQRRQMNRLKMTYSTRFRNNQVSDILVKWLLIIATEIIDHQPNDFVVLCRQLQQNEWRKYQPQKRPRQKKYSLNGRKKNQEPSSRRKKNSGRGQYFNTLLANVSMDCIHSTECSRLSSTGFVCFAEP